MRIGLTTHPTPLLAIIPTTFVLPGSRQTPRIRGENNTAVIANYELITERYQMFEDIGKTELPVGNPQDRLIHARVNLGHQLRNKTNVVGFTVALGVHGTNQAATHRFGYQRASAEDATAGASRRFKSFGDILECL